MAKLTDAFAIVPCPWCGSTFPLVHDGNCFLILAELKAMEIGRKEGCEQAAREQMERDAAAECLLCGNPHWTPAEYDETKSHFYHVNEVAVANGWGPDVCQADRIRRAWRAAHAAAPLAPADPA